MAFRALEEEDHPMSHDSDPSPDSPAPNLRQRVNRRAHELAALAMRVTPCVVQSDYEQAKRDVTGETDRERQFAMINQSLAQ